MSIALFRIAAKRKANPIDRNTGVVESFGGSYVEHEHVITSGSLLSLKAWASVGGYDERMFLGWVDFEFCDNLKANGWKVGILGEAGILHECGSQELTFLRFPKKRKDGNGWELHRYTRLSMSLNRKKDEAAGRVLTISKYWGTDIGEMEVRRIAKSVAKDLFIEKNKVQTIRAYCEGFSEGIRLIDKI